MRYSGFVLKSPTNQPLYSPSFCTWLMTKPTGSALRQITLTCTLLIIALCQSLVYKPRGVL